VITRKNRLVALSLPAIARSSGQALCPLHAIDARHPSCRLGFFITTAEMEPQLELELAERKCALELEGVTITLFNFKELNTETNTTSFAYRLSDTVEVCNV
jgi:hypothetical protein